MRKYVRSPAMSRFPLAAAPPSRCILAPVRRTPILLVHVPISPALVVFAAGLNCFTTRMPKALRDAVVAQVFSMPDHAPVSSRMQLPLDARSKLKASLAALRQGGVVELYERLRRLKQKVPFIFVTERVGSVVRVAPLGLADPGGICTLVSITSAGAQVKYQLDQSLRTVHPSRVGGADTGSQLLASALRSTRSSSSANSGACTTPFACTPPAPVVSSRSHLALISLSLLISRVSRSIARSPQPTTATPSSKRCAMSSLAYEVRADKQIA